MNDAATGAGLLVLALICISVAQALKPASALKSKYIAFRVWWMDKTNPWPVWLFTLGFIALIGAYFK